MREREREGDIVCGNICSGEGDNRRERILRGSRMGEGTAKDLGSREAIKDKIGCRDYTTARTLILEALKTSPRLDKASEMLTVCEILCSADIELLGFGIDWYWVLQLLPSVDAAAIEAQYRKLVSILEPIKDEFPGVGLALKFVGDAYSVLSDPGKKAAFDSKRNVIRSIDEDSNSQAHWRHIDTPSSSGTKRVSHRACVGNEDADEKEKKKICAREASWVMDQLNSQDNGNHQLACEVSDEKGLCSPLAVALKRPEKDFYEFEIIRKLELFSAGQVWAAYDQEKMPRRYARIDMIVPQKRLLWVTWFKAFPQSSHEKRWWDAGFPVTCGTFFLELSNITLSEHTIFSHMISNGMWKQPFKIYPKKGEVWTIYRDWDIEWCSEPEMRKNCGFEMVEVLADYLKDLGVSVAYMVKVDGFKNVFHRYTKKGCELYFQIPSDKLFMFSHKVPAFRFMGGEISKVSKGMLELDPLAVPDNLVQNFTCAILALVDMPLRSYEDVNCSEEASITHLENPSTSTMDLGRSSPETQSRKPKLSPKDFLTEQVWAVYDGPDVMPRSYVRVINVVSPTKVCVTFLEPHPMLDEEIQWVEEGLPIMCGIFRVARVTTNLEMSKFSHLVKCERVSKMSFFRIFPQKGEVWAMYKNWSRNWRSSDFYGSQCRVVEIISDFSEENGSNICSLIEVKGCLTFFHRQVQEGFQLTRQVSRLEVLSFSHRIPAFTVTGIKNRDIPKGSWHLEADALPPKFN